jgi:3-hydroxyacyl-CoA dehydrogenase/enoyl-CoA hydratase/3-hydroxybutyryl-CoA epimerase
LIEVIVLPNTSDDVVATVHGFVQMIGKTPVVVKDSPGFVVNRVLVPYLMEAVKLVESWHDPREIDEAMLDFGMPMGPVRLLDEIGLDVALHVAHSLGAHSDLLKRLVSAGSLGKKGGKGFYLHTSNRVRVNSEVHADAVTPPMMTRAEIQQCLARRLSEEALAVHAEGVARSATDVDLAMVLGAGYAPFRGGPLAFINKG